MDKRKIKITEADMQAGAALLMTVCNKADEADKIRAENERLRTALEEIKGLDAQGLGPVGYWIMVRRVTSKALRGQEGGNE